MDEFECSDAGGDPEPYVRRILYACAVCAADKSADPASAYHAVDLDGGNCMDTSMVWPDGSGAVARVQVLGPLQVVTCTGGAVALGTPKQRAVLALLVMRHGSLVTLEELIDELWADDVPRSARANVQTYVANLRRVLAAPDVDCVTVEGRGRAYVAHVRPSTLDLDIFRAAAERGRAALQAGQWAPAAQHLAAALALWRGDPVQDVPAGRALGARVAALREDRAGIVEDHAEATLALGRPRAVVPVLREHVAMFPLRERGWLLLMDALAGAGDVAAALAAYGQARSTLIDQLGIEPGRALRELHHSLLTGADAGPTAGAPAASAAAAGAAGVAKPPVPAQLPLGVSGFAGRAGELARLDGLLAAVGRQPSAVVAVLSGTAGVGKTALALHWAHRARGAFPDGQLHVNLRGFDPLDRGVEPSDVLGDFLEAFGVTPQQMPHSTEARAALYRSLVADRRLLVVLDNARDAGQVRPLLPGGPGCLVLVTSRSDLAGLVAAEGARPIEIDLLSPADARDLLRHRLGDRRLDADVAATARLIEACARLPLALVVVAARAAVRPALSLADLVEQVAGAGALDGMTGDDAPTDVRRVFSWSYEALNQPAARLFRLFGLHPGPDAALSAIASLAGVGVTSVRPLVDELVSAHLITEHWRGRYACHDLLAAYAAELVAADAAADRDAALNRLLDHYLHSAFASDRQLTPHRDPIAVDGPVGGVAIVDIADHDAALGWFTDEHRTLMAAAALADRTRRWAHVWKLGWCLTMYLDRRGHWDDLVKVNAAGLHAARRTGDLEGIAHSYRNRARAFAPQGRHDEAHADLREALDGYVVLGDRLGQAHTHMSIAVVYGKQQGYQDALDHVMSALALYREIGRREGEGHALNAIGWYHTLLGDHRAALTYCRQGIELSRLAADPLAEAAAWDSAGFAHHSLGEQDDAIACYRHSIGLWSRLGDRYNEADTTDHLGDTYAAAGDHERARRYWTAALLIFDDLGHATAATVRAKLERLDRPAAV